MAPLGDKSSSPSLSPRNPQPSIGVAITTDHSLNPSHQQGLRAGPSSFVHRIFNPPKLERKHSSGDLHSRLKTRKILGVGETDNGDIHRSKISQLLGHNEHLYVKFPRGFWIWHMMMAILITLQGLLALIAPQHFHMLIVQHLTENRSVDAMFATQLAGGALLGMSIMLWGMQGTTEKGQARMSLMAIIIHLLLQIIVNVMFIWHQSIITTSTLSSIGIRTVIVVICVFYHHAIGRSTAGLRKSSSYKDLTTPDRPSLVTRETADLKGFADKKET